MSENNLAQIAAQFINSTSSHLFLTGKAGTGKTTFLRNLRDLTHKNFVVVAPTGIAALNAQGVTIHSQFLLPLGGFIPERNPTGFYTKDTRIFTQHSLAGRHPLNSIRKQVLRNIDLLIIDEVSMLRADVLDAIDYRMRSVKRNHHQSFGGIQVLMIGDLYQLPPIVKNEEWAILKNFYKSMHFFEATSLKKSSFITIELDKIYRQEDPVFIGILNNLRNNCATQQDIHNLNQHFGKGEPEEGVITITTHNAKANEINQRELNKLKSKPMPFDAEIDGDFPESIFPVPETVVLKEGAQVMFVKNDAQDGMYFNGKMAMVEEISDDIVVRMLDDQSLFTLRKEKWENKKYSINQASKEMDEKVVGSFLQYPVKLAWAITVHKSQGLTFDKAVIDVGQAFAPGQVYVALSRLRSLDGLYLKTKISNRVVSSDPFVVGFGEQVKQQPPLPQLLERNQVGYLVKLVAHTFNFIELEDVLKQLKSEAAYEKFKDVDLQNFIPSFLHATEDLREYADVFIRQLQRLIHQHDDKLLFERLEKGTTYYLNFIREKLYTLFLHRAYVDQLKRVKGYLNQMDELDQILMKKWAQLDNVSYITSRILEGLEVLKQEHLAQKRMDLRISILKDAVAEANKHPKEVSSKSKKGPKKEKGQTYQTTFALFKDGMTINEIAISRELTSSTIESHAARGVKEGKLQITDVLTADTIKELEAFKPMLLEESLTPLFKKLNGKYSYGTLRMMKAHLETEN